MFRYGSTSRARRDTCHSTLIKVMDRGLELSPVDIAIIWGWRSQEDQDSMVRMGASKTPWPRSSHNATDGEGNPQSLAFDFGPWVNGRIPWEDTHLFALVAGVFFVAAKEIDVQLRWGGDWDMDGLTTDQTFMDWGHLEMKEGVEK